MKRVLFFTLLSLLVVAPRCNEKQKIKPLTTNCGNTAKWFNSVGKPLKITVTVTDNCPGRDSTFSLYKSESDIAPDVWAAKDGESTSRDLTVPAGGYVKVTCNGEGQGQCILSVTLLE